MIRIKITEYINIIVFLKKKIDFLKVLDSWWEERWNPKLKCYPVNIQFFRNNKSAPNFLTDHDIYNINNFKNLRSIGPIHSNQLEHYKKVRLSLKWRNLIKNEFCEYD